MCVSKKRKQKKWCMRVRTGQAPTSSDSERWNARGEESNVRSTSGTLLRGQPEGILAQGLILLLALIFPSCTNVCKSCSILEPQSPQV